MEKKKIIIDKSKWRTGGSDDKNTVNQTGTGYTRLLNEDGYMCCLGFICNQSGFSKDEIMMQIEPGDLLCSIKGLSYSNESRMESTELTFKAMQVNDNPNTTVDEKIVALKELFKNSEFELEFVDEVEE